MLTINIYKNISKIAYAKSNDYMKKIILSIRHEDNCSFVSAYDQISQIKFTAKRMNIMFLLILVRYKLFKERIKNIGLTSYKTIGYYFQISLKLD